LNRKKLSLPIFALASVGASALENPTFDEGELVFHAGPNSVQSEEGLPGWTVSSPDLLYNGRILTSPWVSIHDLSDAENPPIEGRFSIMLQGGNIPSGSAWIAQGLTIPSESRSLLFRGRDLSGPQVFFEGQEIAYSPVETFPTYVLYGADVSHFAGTAGELRFEAHFQATGMIDNLQFSPLVVPEPSIFALSVIGTAALLFHGRKRILER